jgi:hypothetical protein
MYREGPEPMTWFYDHFRSVVCTICVVLGFLHSHAQIVIIDSTLFFTNQILACPTDTSIMVRIVPKAALQLYYEYGTTSAAYPVQSETVQTLASVPVIIILHHLSPNTRYYYRIRYKTSGSTSFAAGNQCTFMTQRIRGSTFIFTITGDSHLYDKKGIPVMMRVTMQNIEQDHPDFDFELGDTFGDDHTPATMTQQDMMQLHINYMPYIGMICHSAPFFFVQGNHEGESGYYLPQTTPNNIAVYGTLARKHYYSFPTPYGIYTGNTTVEAYGIGQPQNYYAFEWGDALFVVLDVYRYNNSIESSAGTWSWTLGKQQYDWFKAALESSHARYKFVLAHHVRGYGRGADTMVKYFEWGGYENNGTNYTFNANRPGWAMPIHQLMVQNKVSIFFQGHDHLFATEQRDGLVYQEIGMPSDSTYMIGYLANTDAYTGVKFAGTGHMRMTVTPDSTTVEYVSAYLPRDTNATHRNLGVAYRYAVKPIFTSVESMTMRPTEYGLEQNYPNPFNPSTTIHYHLGGSGPVTLKVYNLLGEEVATLVDEWQQAGTHATTFIDGDLSSGVYYYQMKAPGVVLTRKAIVLK